MPLGTNQTAEERRAARNTPAAGEERLRRQIVGSVQQCKAACANIQSIVDDVGFAALSTQLGQSAGEIQSSYSALRTLALALDPTVVIPALNTGV